MSARDFATHEVSNQTPPFVDVNLFTSDTALCEAVAREHASWAAADLTAFGAAAGSAASLDRARLADQNPPRLQRFDARGEPLDVVEFHPAYHEAMAASAGQGLHCAPWEHLLTGEPPRAGTHVARAAGSFMAAQMEPGHCCPITMTHAAAATLQGAEGPAGDWLTKILIRAYDPAFRPMKEKTAVTLGMGMTEKQGGTDVRANTTRATPVDGGRDGLYAITGHKWFLSAPMSDAFLMLAQAPGGLSCFLMPRILPDGSVNAIRLQRLKDKLGNRANASAEAEFHGAQAWLVGEEGRGVPAIIEMVTYTRLDCAVSSAGLMRFALAHAIHHARHRAVFQKKLIDHPLMTRVLADLALDAEAATALAFRLARAYDSRDDETETAYRRLMTPVIKYWICKTGPAFAYEAMECLGGNGYVEDLPLARTYREIPVNAIWEGSGNVMCLDVLRVLQKEPEAVKTTMAGFCEAARGEPRLERALERLKGLLGNAGDIEANARTFVELLAGIAAGCLLRAHAPRAVSDAYLSIRLEGVQRQTYGAGANGIDARAIVERAAPALS